jgi:ABC-type sugar transport system permease subunit
VPGEKRIFFSIVVPQIWPTVITVFITVLIGVMKVFDVVYVTTNGAYNTDVVGRRFYNEMFTSAQRRLCRGHRRPPDDRHHAGAGLPGPSVPS